MMHGVQLCNESLYMLHCATCIVVSLALIMFRFRSNGL
jgi:hypothetical protein